jgi:hypothetical protein
MVGARIKPLHEAEAAERVRATQNNDAGRAARANLHELVEDAGRERGQEEPIAIFNGSVLDGRNRLAACKLAGVEPKFKTVETDSPASYVVTKNLRRRDLNESQRGIVAGRLKPLFFAEDSHRLQVEGGRLGAEITNHPERLVADLPQAARNDASRDKAAKAVKVSPRTVDKAVKVLKHGVPELVNANAPTNPPNERFQQKVGEPLGRAMPAFRLVQLLPNSHEVAGHTCDGGRDHEPGLGSRGVASSLSVKTCKIP